jgi:alkylhydroperoxidase family enzyme
MAHLPSLPRDATLLDVFRKFPETCTPLLEFHEVLLRGPSPFTEGERELIAAYVSGLNGCRYVRSDSIPAGRRYRSRHSTEDAPGP